MNLLLVKVSPSQESAKKFRQVNFISHIPRWLRLLKDTVLQAADTVMSLEVIATGEWKCENRWLMSLPMPLEQRSAWGER